VPAKNQCTSPPRIDAATIELRHPTPEDAAAIHGLVLRSRVLDANSPYCYLLLCSDFAATSLVACHEDVVVGFVVAYRPPPRPKTLFVWQIGVDAAARRCGLGRLLLESLLQQPAAAGVTHLEATVTPSNTASRRLFEGFAHTQGLPCRFDPSAGFHAALFGAAEHEPEDRVRIGPVAAIEAAASP
jgi:L-2,4-diaminobutyric acid acetyltransferase